MTKRQQGKYREKEEKILRFAKTPAKSGAVKVQAPTRKY